MEEKIKQFNNNTYLVFAIIINDIVGIIKPVFKMENGASISSYYVNYDWFGFALNVVMVVVLFIVLKRYQKLRFDTYQQSKMLSVKMKYYDIIHAKFQIDNPSHPTSIYEKDLGWFTEEEKKYLQLHLDQINKVKRTINGIGM